MPDPVKTETTETVETTETTPVETKPLSAREELYKKVGYGGQPADEPAAPEPEPETKTVEPDFKALVAEATAPLLAKIAELEKALPQPVKTEPVAPQKTWVDALKEGDVETFRDLLVKEVSEKVSGTVTKQATAESVAEIEARQEINSFINQVRSENPDLSEDEDWVTSLAAQRMQAAQDAGKIKDYRTYIDIYKESVREAIADVRKRILRYRADGKTEGLTLRKEVVSASTLNPSPTNLASRDTRQPTQPATPDVSPEAYIAARKAREQRFRGLSST